MRKIKISSLALFLVFSTYFVWPDSIPQDIYLNLAQSATASGSSYYNSNYNYDNINDGIKNQWDTGEWASLGEGAGAYVQLSWASPVTINRIDIYGRPNRYDMIHDSYLLIDTNNDGNAEHTLHVGMIPQGGAPKMIYLSSAQGSSVYAVKFLVTEVPSSNLNAGLAEIECYNINGNVVSNTAYGLYTLEDNTTGTYNTAIGNYALYNNTTGTANTAIGYGALKINTTGYYNIAIGDGTLYYNTTGSYNTGAGISALAHNTSGTRNTATGFFTLLVNTTASDNTAMGYYALEYSTGSGNTAIGSSAGYANTTGTNNTFIGYTADASTGSYNNSTAIGYGARITGSNQVRIGDSSVTSIGGYAGWSNISDIRIKKKITDNDIGLEFISRLRPVHYEMKKGHEGTIYDGFIAQDVEQVMNELGITFSGLVKPDNPENMYSLSYSTFVVPLVNAVKELNAKIKDQDEKIEKLVEEIQELRRNR